MFSVSLCSGEKGNLGVPQLPGQGCSFHSFRTNTYKLSFMESPSGIKVSCNNIFVSFHIIVRFLWMQSLMILEFCVKMFYAFSFAHLFIDKCSYLDKWSWKLQVFVILIGGGKLIVLCEWGCFEVDHFYPSGGTRHPAYNVLHHVQCGALVAEDYACSFGLPVCITTSC